MKTKKLLSILLALMMMLSVVPMYASAADPIALTRSNVKIIPPVAEPSVASYGITYSDIALTGGTLWYVSEDGTETLVPGKFVWTSSGSTNPINVGTVNPGLKFQPDDQTAFSTSGRLSATSTTIVSGEWPTLTILGTPTPRISEVPTVSIVEGITKTYGEATIEGGTAVDKDTNAIIPGKFVVADEYAEMSVVTGEGMRITVRFIPDDLEAYTDMATKDALVLVKKIYKLVDKNGEEVTVPEFTLPYGTTFDTGNDLGVAIKSMIKDRSSLSGADTPYISFPDHDRDELAPLGTNTYTVRIYPSHEGNSNYVSTYYQFILTIEPAVIELSLKSELDEENANIHYYYLAKKNYNDPAPKGTFTYYIDGELAAENVGMGYKVKLAPEKSGTHEIKIVYNPVENDPFIIEDINRTTNIKLLHKLNRGNLVMGGRPEEWYGDEVKLDANIAVENLGGWKFTDADGNEVVLEDAVYEGRYVTFTMPDFDLNVEFIDKRESSDDSGNIDDIFGDLGDLTEGDSDNPFENIINNLVAFFKNIINTIKNFFRGIGDMT